MTSTNRHITPNLLICQTLLFFFWLCSMWDLCSDQGSNLHHLHWKCKVLTTGPSGKSLNILTSILMSNQNLQLKLAIMEFITPSCPTDTWVKLLSSPLLSTGPHPLTHLLYLQQSNLCWFLLLSGLLVLSLPFQTQFFIHSFYYLNSQPRDFSLILYTNFLRSRDLKYITCSTLLRAESGLESRSIWLQRPGSLHDGYVFH